MQLRAKRLTRAQICCVVCVFVTIFLYVAPDFIPIYTFRKNLTEFSAYHKYHVFNRLNPNLHTSLSLSKLANNNNIIGDEANIYNKSGYGIIFTGNYKLLKLIYVSISIINYLNFTQYPIEVFLNGRDEESDISKCNKYFNKLRKRLNISCLYINDDLTTTQSRFTYKIIALLRTSFRHTLFLDDDNIIIQSPDVLFKSSEYVSNRAIFWPDFWGIKCLGLFQGGFILYESCFSDNGIYNVLDNKYIKYDINNIKYTQSQEAAQLVIDTVKYYNVLEAVLICTDSSKYQQYLHGDKDCFRFMWLERNQSFYYVDIQPQYVGFTRIDDKNDSYFYRHSLLQFWNNKNNPIFIHQTKWIEPMDHTLWEYNQQLTDKWSCNVNAKGSDHIYPFPLDEKYIIQKTVDSKVNGRLIEQLEPKWIQFWKEAHHTTQ